MKNMVKRVAAFLMAFAMVFGFAGGALPAEACGFSSDAWESNVITADPFKAFGLERDQVGTVTFLDTMEDAPKSAWNMGKGASSRVKGWMEWEGGLANVYFAANGGINGEKCTEEMFSEMTALTDVEFNGAFHTEEVESMSKMFYNCESLEYVDVETLDTSNVTTMREMFRGCAALEKVDVSTWNTGKVKTMYGMFTGCTNLEELDLSGFDTSRVTNIGFMFSACKSLEEVDVSTWDTGKVTNMEGVFRWCDLLEEPDLDGWNFRKVKSWSNFMNPGMRINNRPWECFFK